MFPQGGSGWCEEHAAQAPKSPSGGEIAAFHLTFSFLGFNCSLFDLFQSFGQLLICFKPPFEMFPQILITWLCVNMCAWAHQCKILCLPDLMSWHNVCAMLEQMQVAQIHPVGGKRDLSRCWRCRRIGEEKGRAGCWWAGVLGPG